MNFDELDERMRVFETAHDHCVLPGIFMVARLDGRGFTRLTKEEHEFAAPFDERFCALMVHTTRHLMERTIAEKNELLFSHGINFDALPAWHKRGVGLWWESYEKLGRDPRTGMEVPAVRRRLREEPELPFGAEYEAMVAERVTEAEATGG